MLNIEQRGILSRVGLNEDTIPGYTIVGPAKISILFDFPDDSASHYEWAREGVGGTERFWGFLNYKFLNKSDFSLDDL